MCTTRTCGNVLAPVRVPTRGTNELVLGQFFEPSVIVHRTIYLTIYLWGLSIDRGRQKFGTCSSTSSSARATLVVARDIASTPLNHRSLGSPSPGAFPNSAKVLNTSFSLSALLALTFAPARQLRTQCNKVHNAFHRQDTQMRVYAYRGKYWLKVASLSRHHGLLESASFYCHQPHDLRALRP
jgi:hypothetical protein